METNTTVTAKNFISIYPLYCLQTLFFCCVQCFCGGLRRICVLSRQYPRNDSSSSLIARFGHVWFLVVHWIEAQYLPMLVWVRGESFAAVVVYFNSIPESAWHGPLNIRKSRKERRIDAKGKYVEWKFKLFCYIIVRSHQSELRLNPGLSSLPLIFHHTT